MKKNLIIILIFSFLMGCSVVQEQQKKEVVEAAPLATKKEKVLCHVSKIEIPRIENQENIVQVHIWGARPSLDYGKEEIEITKEETGYTIRLWLLPQGEAFSLDVFKKVEIAIKEPGGHDIEVIGKHESFADIVFIDQNIKIE